MSGVVIVLPEQSDGYISEALCLLTRRLQEITGEGPHGVLGGPDGYGCEYENDVFMMHPYCWCEDADCRWCLACFCPNEYAYYSPNGQEISEQEFNDYRFEEYPRGTYFDAMKFVGEQCRNCAEKVDRAPNFLFKPTDAKVTWYKYIGRGMELDGDFPADFLAQCLMSLEDQK